MEDADMPPAKYAAVGPEDVFCQYDNDTDYETVVLLSDGEQTCGPCEPDAEGTPEPAVLRPLSADLPGLFLQSNLARGDCQFWSLAQALNAYDGVNVAALRARLSMLSLSLGDVTAKQLRRLAYTPFLLPNAEADAYLQHWKISSMDASMADVYPHARCLHGKSIDTLTHEDRCRLVRVLFNASVTWGDETSLLFLERLLQIRVDVIFDGHLQIRDMCHHPNFVPLVYTVMNLRLRHYECVLFTREDGRHMSAFAPAEVPPVLLALHAKHCASAMDAHVRLAPSDVHALSSATGAGYPLPPDTMLDHFLLCNAALDKEEDAAAEGDTCSTTSSDLRQRLTTTVDGCFGAELCSGSVLPLIEADGGTQHPGEIEAVVTMLQCGMAVCSGTPAPRSSNMFPDGVLPSRLPHSNPVPLWA